MRTHSVWLVGIVLIAVCTLAGCNGNGTIGAGTAASTSATSPGPSTDASAGSSSETEYGGPTIPQGLWTRHLTPAKARSAARKNGLSGNAIDEIMGQFREDLAYSFKVGSGAWAQYQAVDGGELSVGDSGTFTYDAEGQWITVSEGTGCPGCVIAFRWSVDGQRLTLTVVPGLDEDDDSTFVTEGTYQLSS